MASGEKTRARPRPAGPLVDPRWAPVVAACAVALVLVVAVAANLAPDFGGPAREVASPVDDDVAPPASTGSGGDAASLVGVVVVGVAILFAVVAMRVLDARRLLRLAAFLGLAIVLLLVVAPLLRFDEAPPPEALVEELAPPEDVTVEGRAGPSPLLLAVLGVLALGAIGAVVLRRREVPGEGEDDAALRLGETVRLGLGDIDAIADHRLAVVTAYARLEAGCAAAGFGRAPAETSREYVGRILGAHLVDPSPVEVLGRLYEHARYDVAPVGPGERAAAVGALADIDAALSTAALR